MRKRINDPLSKILVTGNVNAGKSTVCNALLRRRILPEDQQQCTTIFCEVLCCTPNRTGLEEVHANTVQHSHDVFELRDLERVVTDARYTQCKVFVDDLRTADESLLSSDKVVDIALIEAPVLNHDTTHTTAVFARQEEIDVVVFVVSATSYFTISAKEFLRAATAEKEYLFIVVNAFDTITNKERYKKASWSRSSTSAHRPSRSPALSTSFPAMPVLGPAAPWHQAWMAKGYGILSAWKGHCVSSPLKNVPGPS